MKILNATNLPCPMPVIMAKKELSVTPEGESFVIEVDNLIAAKNLEKMVKGYGNGFRMDIADGNYHIKITKVPSAVNESKSQTTSAETLFAVAVGSNCMGKGSDALGEILMRTMLSTVQELDVKPSVILFFNSGVKLCVNNSKALPILKELSSTGISIMSCGACLDFYKLKESLAVGEITNMFTILTIMSEADKLINL